MPSFLVRSSTTATNQCESEEEAKKSLAKYLADHGEALASCSIPCSVFSIKAIETSYNYLNPTTSVHQGGKSGQFGYIVFVPSRVKRTATVLSYSLTSLVAEFGGWCGVFIGLSILAACNDLLLALSKYIAGRNDRWKEGMAYVKILLSFLVSCFLLYLGGHMLERFLRNEKSTSIQVYIKHFSL